MPRQLEDWITSFLVYTDNSEPPYSFRLWTAVSVIAACMRRKCVLEWDKPLYPNMYIVLTSPPGKARKGTAMAQGMMFLREMGIPLAPDATTLQALIVKLDSAGDGEVVDSVVKPHASLTVFSEELTVFLGYQNKELMALLCNWFDCPDLWEYKTKNVGEYNIRNVWVNLLGATTPDQIKECLPQSAIGGGLTSRIIFVYERDKDKDIPFPFSFDKETARRLMLDLEDIRMLRGEYKISEEFIPLWQDWYTKNSRANPLKLKHFGGYASRRPIHILKLCMILSASSRRDLQITDIDLLRAIDILENTEKTMTEVFMGFGKSPIADTLHQMGLYIHGRGRQGATEAEIHRRFYDDADAQTMEAILLQLKKMGRITAVVQDDRTTLYRWKE